MQFKDANENASQKSIKVGNQMSGSLFKPFEVIL